MSAVIQRSPEWYESRLGRVTASRVADVVAKTKTGYGAGRRNYLAELVAERLTGQPTQGYCNAAMQWGIDTEPQARKAYEFVQSCIVREVGFVPHPDLFAGASPDGLVGADGLVEIKCPNTATHLDTLLGSGIDRKYHLQMQWQMACTGRQWCDFASFDPRLPLSMQLHITRVPRDEKLVTELTLAVSLFIGEIDDMVAKLREQYE